MEAIAWLALKQRLEQFTEPNLDITYVDSGYEPDADEPYIFAQFVPTPYEAGLLDPDCGDDFRGSLIVSVCVPLTWDAAAHLGLAGRVARWFKYGGKYYWGNDAVTIYRMSKVISQPRRDQAHNRVDVDVRWRIWGR